MSQNQRVVLAFSGGLDTSYCAAWLKAQGWQVHTLTVQTGGFDADELGAIERRAKMLGVAGHAVIDARAELFDDYLKYLVFGNVLRGDAYPLCVSVERVAQAKRCALYAREIGAAAVAHGSTGAGNDQVRFDVVLKVLAPELAVLTPIRDQALSREQEAAFLAEQGVEVSAATKRYSINAGLWGVTIGGGETHRSDGVLPEEAYVWTPPAAKWPTRAEDVAVRFERGVPVALDGTVLDPVALIEQLNQRAGRHGVGRGMHVGDTILGIKGRVAYEAPAAVVLVAAHRELEKLVLSRGQQFWKRTLGDLYGGMLHEARFFDPLMRDLEAFLASSQRVVTGTVNVRLYQGQASVLGVTSPHSLMNADRAKYGEGSALWTGDEAAAFCKLYGLADGLLWQAAGKGGNDAALA